MSRVVIDQSGFKIFILGLVFSSLIGLILRAQISEKRVQVYLDKSINRIQANFHVDYESAKISLSRWGLPFPALVIQKIRLSPKSMLCQNSQIYIEELEIPISIFNIAGFSQTIPKIRISEMELRLSDTEKCIVQNKLNPINESSRFVAETPSEVRTENQTGHHPELKDVSIENLKIISSKKTDQPILLKQLNLELFYRLGRLSEVNIKAKLSALKDARSEIYFFNAELVALLKIKESDKIESVINIKGKLLDGDAHLFVHNTVGSGRASYELSLKHVSAKAFASLIPDFNEINLEKTPLSISFKNSGQIYFNNKNYIESKFKNIQINVDGGLLSADEAELYYHESHFIIKPFELKIKSLPLTMLKSFNLYKNKLDSFESLGQLSGRLEFINRNSYKFLGEIKNTQVIFSNRGLRDLQNVDHADIKIIRKASDVKFEAADFIINNEKISGSFWAHHNLSTLDMIAQLKLSGVSLQEKIWKQFTLVEQSPKVGILWNYKKINLKNNSEVHDIKIYIDKILLPDIKLVALNVGINQILSDKIEDRNLRVTVKSAHLLSEPEFIENKLVNEVLNTKNGFKLKTINSTKTDLIFMGPDWKNINFNLNSYFLSDSSSKSETLLTVKGNVTFKEGLVAMIIMSKRGVTHKFNLTKNSDELMTIKNIQ